MTELLTAAQMRAIEQAAIDSGEVTGLELMARAGQGVVDAILEWRPELAEGAHRAVVLCGPGNNGGDGFVVARLLQARGWDIEVFLYGCPPDDLSRLPPDAQTNARRWMEIGTIAPLKDDTLDAYHTEGPSIALAIDALFGIGLSRPFDALPTLLAELNYWQAASWHGETPHVVAIDVPSGLCSDSGRYLGYENENPLDWAAMANLTVAFHSQKRGHLLQLGPLACGHIVIADIGLAPERADPTSSSLAEPAQRWLGKPAFGHKFSHGHALVLSGGVGKGGAARLAARGALRVGAGLVTVGCPPAALIENACRLDAIMLRPIADADALREALADPRVNDVCLGPGLGVGERTRALVEAAQGRRVVLDADALTSFEEDPEALFRLLGEHCVLTPHEGEFGRLFPDILAKLRAPATKGPAYSKIDATREAAKRAGCVVLFKGADTVIADPSGRASINSAHYDRAAPWLATAGSGDVLAGMITGLLARGLSPMDAAETAAWLHVECALQFGPGLIAEDLPEQLPAVFAKLGL